MLFGITVRQSVTFRDSKDTTEWACTYKLATALHDVQVKTPANLSTLKQTPKNEKRKST